MYKRIFVPVDGSETSTRGLKEALKLARQSGARLRLLHVIDESVLASKFPMKDEWAGSPLQLEYFNDFAAGEEFYNKLKAIRGGSDSEKRSQLEVYFLCLTHGFKGMYIDLKGMEERRALLDALAAELKQGLAGDATRLSPSWQPPDDLPRLVRGERL